MSLQEKMKRLKLTPLPIHKSPAPVQVTLDDESLHDEIEQIVSKGNVESIVYYAKDYVKRLTRRKTKTLDVLHMIPLWLRALLTKNELTQELKF